jgi:hypothetical protein
MATEIQYIDRDNVIDLLLKADGEAQELDSITKMDLIIGSVTISDSAASAYPIKWSSTGTTGKIQLQLGSQPITEGVYSAQLIVYSATYPNGLVWGSFNLYMRTTAPDPLREI